jgi:hypothetical protein
MRDLREEKDLNSILETKSTQLSQRTHMSMNLKAALTQHNAINHTKQQMFD